MQLISYHEMDQLRLSDYIGPGTVLDVEESGIQICLGLGGVEALGDSYFGWPQGQPYHTAEVAVDLSDGADLPPEAANRIIKKLRLPLFKGISAAELLKRFGSPEIDNESSPKLRFLRFICGEADKFLLGCRVEGLLGLVHFFLTRKDIYDEWNRAVRISKD